MIIKKIQLISVLFLGFCANIFSQLPSFEWRLENEQLTSATTYQFDVNIYNTGSASFEVRGGTIAFMLDTEWTNSGILTVATPSSGMNSGQLSGSASFAQQTASTEAYIRKVINNVGAGIGTNVPANSMVKCFTFVLTNTTKTFSTTKPPKFAWRFIFAKDSVAGFSYTDGLGNSSAVVSNSGSVWALFDNQSYCYTPVYWTGTAFVTKSQRGFGDTTITLTSAHDVNIFTGTYSGSLNVRGYNLLSGATHTMASNESLKIRTELKKFGTLNSSNASIQFLGNTFRRQSTNAALNASVINVNSSLGVSLGGSLTVTDTLSLINGNVFLSNNNLIMGASAKRLVGSASSYIVTDSTGTLNISNIGTAAVTFPVGTVNGYNPIAIQNTGTVDDFQVSVSKGVKASGTSITSNVVNRTWKISETNPGNSNLNINLQWNAADELPLFNRANSYISFVNNSGLWQASSQSAALGSSTYLQTLNGVVLNSGFNSFAVASGNELNQQITHTINASSGANGSIMPAGLISVSSGASRTYTFTPNPGYMVDSVIVDGIKVDSIVGYTFNNVTSNRSIRVTYRPIVLNVQAPTITSFSPNTGTVGTLVTILGTNLNAIDTLRIGGVSAIKISAKTDTLVAMVMPGATTGSIYLANGGGNITSVSNFTKIASVPPMVQQGNKLVGIGNVGNAQQGQSVSLSADGNTAVVGGTNDNSSQGAAWIFTLIGNTWTQQGNKLVGTGNIGASIQGCSVSLSADGNTAIVGGYADSSYLGAAWVYTRSGNTWTQQGNKLVGTGSIGSAYQGISVSLSADGNTAIVGGNSDNSGQGAAWIFTRSGNTWNQQGNKLVGTGNIGQALQGTSVSLSADGNTAIVGGSGDNSGQGAAWVYTRSGNTWTQQGNKLVATGNIGNAQQGQSVSLSADGNTAIVGGRGDNSYQGAAWIYTRSGNTWTQQGNKLVGTGSSSQSLQGWSVSLSADGNTAIVGGFNDINQGASWVYTRIANIWTQQGSKLVGTGSSGVNGHQGFSVSLSANGNVAIIGGPADNSNQGAAWVYSAPPTYTISAQTNANGTISPSGNINITHGASQRFLFTPNPGYMVDSVIVDGIKVDSIGSYTFNNISANQTIRVTFKISLAKIFFADSLGTIKCINCVVGDTGTVNGVVYEAVDRTLLDTRKNQGADLTKLCTSLVTDMSSLFENNTFFNQAIGNWDVSKVTNMYHMFYNDSIFNQPLGNWDVSSVTNMGGMFGLANNFNQPIGNWNVNKVTDMSWMFANVWWYTVPMKFNQDISNWDVSSVTNMEGMFENATSFNQPIGSWDVSKVTNMGRLFHGCISFNQPLANWNVDSVTNMSATFGRSGFNQPIGNWNVGAVTNMSEMFTNCPFNQPIINWNVSKVTYMEYMFAGNYSFNQPLGNWDVSSVIDMRGMFSNSGFNKAIGNWNISKVRDISEMFFNSQFNQDISGWDVSQVTSMNGTFVNCPFNQPIGNWDVSNVTNMNQVFRLATAFNQDISNWNVSKVTRMDLMFQFANSFNQPIGNWDVSSVNSMENMFDGATTFNQKISNWCVKNIDTIPAFFANNCPIANSNKPIWGTCPYTINASSGGNGSITPTGAIIVNSGSNQIFTFTPNPGYMVDSVIVDGIKVDSIGSYTFNNISANQTIRVTFKISLAKIFFADSLGTIKCINCVVGDTGTVNGVVYEAVDRTLLDTRKNQGADLTKLCTSLVTDMSSLFENNTFFNQAIGNWDVSKVTNMYHMFYNDSIFNQPLGNWDVSSVTNMGGMFGLANNFNQPIGNWNVNKVTDMSWMFANVWWYTVPMKFNQDISNWDVSSVTNMEGMFENATSFNQPIGSWDVSKVTNMGRLFHGCISFNQPLANWNVDSVTNMSATFGRSGFNQPIGNWNVGAVTNMSEMFTICPFNQPINNWNVSKVQHMNWMFHANYSFNQPIGNWDVSSVIAMGGMFWSTVFNQPIGSWNISNVNDIRGMFFNSNFNQNISNWDVSNVTNMNGTFVNCPFNQPIGNWDVSNVTDMNQVFRLATAFNQDISNWNVSKVTRMDLMFQYATNFNQPIGNWDVSSVNNMDNMFEGATAFNQNISTWCVSNITAQPNNFSTNCPITNANKPIWGTCPYTINASSGANGSITPTGAIIVNSGSNQIFTFTPNTGYMVDSVIVDGVKVDSIVGYTFNNVTSNRSIRVTYRPIVLNVQAPTITSFSPNTGTVGTLVTILGTNLNAIDTLRIGGVSAIKISAKTDTLVAMVMPGATTGSIYLANGGGNITSISNFTKIASVPPMVQQGNKLVGTGSVGSAYQGYSVSLSADGNTAIVGGRGDNSSQGAAWIYIRSGNTWTQQGNKLIGTGNVGAAYQGWSVSLSANGNTAIVAGFGDNSNQGAAWVFTRSGNTWTQQGNKLVGTGSVGSAYQGYSVSLSADGNTAIVGGVGDNGWQGAAWLYTRTGNIWTQQGNKLVGTGSVNNAYQGFSVSLSADGNTAIVGGVGDNGWQGAAWVYTRSGNTWTQLGNKLVGTGSIGSGQGISVSLSADGNTAIVGGNGDNNLQGAAWIYTRSGNTWTQQGNKLVGTGSVGNAEQGYSVSLSADGNTAIVCGISDNGDQGAAWVYTRSGITWTQQGNKLVGTGSIGNGIREGYSVSLSADGNTAIVGGIGDNGNQGAAWVYSAPPTYTISAQTNANGTISPSGNINITHGASQRFLFTPNPGYMVDSVIVDGIKVDSLVGYTFSNVTSNRSIRVVFIALPIIPYISISSIHPIGSYINTNTPNNVLASYQIIDSVTNALLSSLSYTTQGSYTSADIQSMGFKCWINSTNDLVGATQIGTGQAVVASGGVITFTGLSQNIPIGTSYILVTCDISTSAEDGNTIGLTSTPIGNFTFSGNTTIFGNSNLAAGNLFTINETGPVKMQYRTSNSYKENFSDIANWTNGFASGIGAGRWAGVASNFGNIPNAKAITVSTSNFQTSSSGEGIQRGSLTGNVAGTLAFLSLGNTDDTSACAVDFFMDYTRRNADSLVFDAANIFNGVGNRNSTMRVYWSIDGTNFTELTGNNLPYIATNNVANSGTIRAKLPSAFNNVSTCRLRFYYHNGTGGTTGLRPKISIDNVQVSAICPEASSTTSISSCTPYTWNGVTYNSSGVYYKTFSEASAWGCDSVASLNLNMNPIVSFNPFQDTLKVCGTSYTLNAGSGFVSYEWNSTANTSTISPNKAGWYNVTVSNGTCSASDSVYLSLNSGKIDQNEVTVCPNVINIFTASDSATITPISYLWSTGETSSQIEISANIPITHYCTISNGVNSCVDSVTIKIDTISLFNPFPDTLTACGTSYTLIADSGYASYTWNTGSTDRIMNATSAGWKICTASNGSCSASDSLLLSLVNADITNRDTIICLGKSITLNATGSGVISSPLSYLWSDGAIAQNIIVSPAQTTSYYCTVSNGINSCKDSVKVTKDNFNPNLFVQDTLKVCGTSYTLNADSGYASYLWNSGSSARSLNTTTAGWKNCTVSNGLCSSKDSVLLSMIHANIINNDSTIVAGTPITLRATGTGIISTPLTYLWSIGANTQNINVSPTQKTTYYCTVSNGISSCADTVKIWVNLKINLKMYFEAFYENGSLKSSLYNANGISDIALFDTVQIMLLDSMSNAIVYSIKSIADTGGVCQILIPSAYAGSRYYIGIKHRGSIETWTNSSVLLNNGLVYNFTSSASKAYGANLKDDGNGIYLIYNGDVNQDGSVDFNDYPDLDISSNNGDLGYYPTDLNGDGSVDFGDYPTLDINSNDGIIALTPIVYNGFIKNKSIKKSLIGK
jgi:surface protein